MNKEKRLEAILVISMFMLLLYFLKDVKVYILISFIIGLTGIFLKPVANGVSWLWLKLGVMLGAVVPKIILTVVYYVFLLPVSLLYRIFKKDNLNLKRNTNTYWKQRNHKYISKDIENIW